MRSEPELSDELRRAVDEHIVEVYLRLASACPGVTIERQPSSTLVLSAFPHAMGNFALRFRFSDADDARNTIGELGKRFDDAHRQRRVYLTGLETPEGLAPVLRAHGMRETFMLDQMVHLNPGPTKPHLECIPVTTLEMAEVIGEFGAREFFPMLEPGLRSQVSKIMAEATWDIVSRGDGHAVFIERHGKPVASGLVCVTGEVAGIYNVATAVGWRRKGMGTAVTAALMDCASRTKCKIVTLQATEMGRGLYDHAGFRRFGSVRCFVN